MTIKPIKPIKSEEATSLSDFFRIIKGYSAENRLLWFRGHASDEYKLAPSIYREPYKAENELEFMNLFKAKGVKFFSDKVGYFEWLFIMQHYGTPTRLLDWSESATVALAFATQYRSPETINNDAVIWCLDPFKINELANVIRGTSPSIINICEETEIGKIYQSNGRSDSKPIAILGSYESERIIAQKGVFTLFPMIESFNMEELPNAESFLKKIVIPRENVADIANELYYIGTNEMSLFPEPESISKEIKRFIELR